MYLYLSINKYALYHHLNIFMSFPVASKTFASEYGVGLGYGKSGNYNEAAALLFAQRNP